MRALKSTGGSTAATAGRKVSAVEAYRRVEDIPTPRELAIMVSAILKEAFPSASCAQAASPLCAVHWWVCHRLLNDHHPLQAHLDASLLIQHEAVITVRATLAPNVMQVDQKNESILVPIYGLMVPFHILAVKNAVNSQEGDHSYIRINFNFGPAYEPGAKFPHLVFLKELSYRTSDNRHAAKVGFLPCSD